MTNCNSVRGMGLATKSKPGIAAVTASENRHNLLGLTAERLLDIYQRMVLSRTLDQRVWQLNRQGKAAIVASAQGHEAAQVGSALALDKDRDLFFTYYRSMAVCVALGVTPTEVLLTFMAKVGEPFSGARQFPLHGAYMQHRIINVSNVVAAHLTKADGAALAFKTRQEFGVVIAYFGDGASSEGECHEAMNFAGVHRLPIIFFCENNRYAISVPLDKQMAIQDVAIRAQGYGFPGVVVDGSDLLAVMEATGNAAARARAGEGPTLIEAKVERFMPHTSDDDDRRYRSKAELEEMRGKADPLGKLRSYLLEQGILTPEMDKAYLAKALAEVNEATDFAEKAPYPDTSTFYDHLHSPGTRGV